MLILALLLTCTAALQAAQSPRHKTLKLMSCQTLQPCCMFWPLCSEHATEDSKNDSTKATTIVSEHKQEAVAEQENQLDPGSLFATCGLSGSLEMIIQAYACPVDIVYRKINPQQSITTWFDREIQRVRLFCESNHLKDAESFMTACLAAGWYIHCKSRWCTHEHKKSAGFIYKPSKKRPPRTYITH